MNKTDLYIRKETFKRNQYVGTEMYTRDLLSAGHCEKGSQVPCMCQNRPVCTKRDLYVENRRIHEFYLAQQAAQEASYKVLKCHKYHVPKETGIYKKETYKRHLTCSRTSGSRSQDQNRTNMLKEADNYEKVPTTQQCVWLVSVGLGVCCGSLFI